MRTMAVTIVGSTEVTVRQRQTRQLKATHVCELCLQRHELLAG